MKSLWKVSHTRVVHLSALFLTLLFSLASLASCNQPAPPQYVSLHLGIPAAALQSPVKGPLPDATVLHVGITFKIDPRLLAQAEQQKIQPGQSSYLEALAKRLGIDDATYQKIKQFFSSQDIALSLSKLRTHLAIQARAGTLAKVFQTKFVIHQYKGRTFYAPATPPKVPAFLANSIDSITGLDNYSKPPKHALDITYPQASHHSQHGAQDCSPNDQTLLPSDVATAYGYTTLYQHGRHGEHMTINLVETDSSYSDDIQNYLSCIHFKGHLSFINVDGGPSDAQGESTLDVQMVAGLAPDASIKVYQTDGNADDPWTQVNDELQHILDDNTANANAGSVVSISLGIDEADISSDDVRALDSSLQQLTQVEHMTVFVASGDCGAFADETFGDLSVSFPATDPWAVAVGGTELSVDGQGNRTDEVAWSSQFPNIFHCNNSWGTGGGNSSLFHPPDWQKGNGVNNQYSQNDRQVPDVAAVADNLAVYFQGSWGAVAGTSASAPIWAAGQALVNEDTIQRLGSFGYAPRFYYAVANKNGGGNAYFDVTSGNNLYYPATPGWDYATGFGTPNLASFDQGVSSVLE